MTKTNNAARTLCTAYHEAKQDRKKFLFFERIFFDFIVLTAPVWFRLITAYSNWAIPTLGNGGIERFLIRALEVYRDISTFLTQCYAYRLSDTGAAPLVIFVSGILFISYIEWGIREVFYYSGKVKEFKETKN